MAKQSPQTLSLSTLDRLSHLEARLDALEGDIASLRKFSRESIRSTQDTLRRVRRARKERTQRVDVFTCVVPSDR